MTKLIEGEDFYLNDEGLMIFTAHFLKKRGFCCHSGCTHCPYGIHDKYDPNFPIELQVEQEERSDYEKYLDYDDSLDED